MNELIILLVTLFVAYFFIPAGMMSRIFSNQSGKNDSTRSAGVKSKWAVNKDSMVKSHFLSEQRTEIKAEIIPSPIDLALCEYYETLVAEELQKRLAR